MYIGNSNYVMTNRNLDLPHNYISTVNPTIDVNPPIVNMTWLNTTTGEIFVCLSNVIGANFWTGNKYSYVGVPIVYSLPTPDVVESVLLPHEAYNNRIVVYGGDLISSQHDSGIINIYDGFSATVKETFTVSANVMGIGVTTDGNLVCLLGATTSYTVHVYSGISNNETYSFSVGGYKTGMCFMNGDLVLAQYYNPDSIVRYVGISSTVQDTLNPPAGQPYDTTFDGVNLISCDYDTARIYVHDGFSENILKTVVGPSSKLSSIAHDSIRLYSFSDNTFYAYKHKREDEV